MKALVFAYSEIGAVGIETLLDLGVEVVGVVTHIDSPWEERWFRSVGELARSKGIPVQTPDQPNTPEVLAWGQALRPDIVFSFYYRKLLKKTWLELAPLGAFNLHGSLLPKFRGRACVNWALIEGVRETGVTLHEMIERADAGDIVGQERVAVGPDDTAPQVEADATTFGARRPEDGRIDWRWPARRIHNWVRALARPYPGAFTFLGGRKLMIWTGSAAPDSAAGIPGQVLEPRAEGGPVVTGDGLYLVREVQWEGGSAAPAEKVLIKKENMLCES